MSWTTNLILSNFILGKVFFPASLVHKRVQGGSLGGLGDHPPQHFEWGDLVKYDIEPRQCVILVSMVSIRICITSVHLDFREQRSLDDRRNIRGESARTNITSAG